MSLVARSTDRDITCTRRGARSREDSVRATGGSCDRSFMRAFYGLVLAFAACSSRPATQSTTTPSTSPTPKRAASHDRELIEQAYAAKNATTLHELLDI